MMDYFTDISLVQWLLVLLSTFGILFLVPRASTVQGFFFGENQGRQPSVIVLTSSLVISWLFAKSITNAANLGMTFGLIGSLAYAVYYLSFLVAGIIIYRLRTVGLFTSIHHFIRSRFGKAALALFSMLIVVRLFNEVWSNTMVIGSYFGAHGSSAYYSSIVVFTVLTLAYSLKGGMQSSLVSDVIQMGLFALLLVVILGVLLPRGELSPSEILYSGTWSMATGGNLLLVACIQVLSYPFHDPVLTDRGFIADSKSTLKAFIYSTFIGMLCILLFSIVGIYASKVGLSGEAPVEVAQLLGVPMMLLMNLIMITSAASTLDSTFSSFAKLWCIDLKFAKATISTGRIAMCGLVLLGTIPVFFNPAVLSATTISGTMVLGLAPIFTLWRLPVPRISYFLSVAVGIVAGLALVMIDIPDAVLWTTGKYADLLGVNVVATLLCYIVYLLPYIIELLVKPNSHSFIKSKV